MNIFKAIYLFIINLFVNNNIKTDKLKELYQQVIEDKKYEVRADGKDAINVWHDNYKHFYDEVCSVREQIKSGIKLSKDVNEDFLRRLLFELDNGIANMERTAFTEEVFQIFINNEKFISALESLIVNPTNNNYKSFKQTWEDLRDDVDNNRHYNPTRINRVAAACTLELSSSTKATRLKEVINYLVTEGLIMEYPDDEDKGWFAKNQFLFREIKREFQNELSNGQTDEFYLSIFIRLLHEHIKKKK